MTQTPRLTLGLPVYNGARLLPAAFESVLAQEFGDFELIVSDNGSRDDTEQICRDWAARDARIRYVRHDRNRGASFNHNFCVEQARGALFKWCSDDDVLAASFLARCVSALDERPDAVLAYTWAADIGPDGRLVRERDDHITGITGRPSARFSRVLHAVAPCFPVFGVVRTEVLRRTAMLGRYTSSDRVLLAELALHGPWQEVPERLFLHREHPRRSTHTYPGLRQRAAWFDPRNARRRVMPTWRMLVGYRRAIRRSGVPAAERLRCEREVVRWAVARPGALVREVLRLPDGRSGRPDGGKREAQRPPADAGGDS